jgi:transcriptional regulator with XRE-family HTH domain
MPKLGKPILDFIDTIPYTFEHKLHEIRKSYNLTQEDLALLARIHTPAVSVVANGQRDTLNKYHLLALMYVLRITDIRELFDIKFDEELAKKMDADRQWMLENKRITPELEEELRQLKIKKASR